MSITVFNIYMIFGHTIVRGDIMFLNFVIGLVIPWLFIIIAMSKKANN